MTRKLIKIIAAFAVVAGLFLLAAVLIASRPTGPQSALPNPNGYDDFVKAGESLLGSHSDWSKMDAAQLRALIQTNTATLKLLRAGLAHECAIPPDYSGQLTNHFTALSTFKSLAQLLAAEGRLAELEKRTNDAARSYAEGIRFGLKSARRGVLIDALVGLACENLGAMPLEKLLPRLEANTCRELARSIEASQAARESAEDVLQSEKNWAFRTHGVRGVVSALFTFPQMRKTRLAFISKYNAQQSRTRQLLLNLASRACELDTGHPPTAPTDLVPKYLKAIPAKPAASPAGPQ
jgi:hypothetical protein